MAGAADNDPVYVAVGKDVEKNRLTLLWALRNLKSRKLYLLHVHQPTRITPSSSGLEESEINEILRQELNSAYEGLHWYAVVCQNEEVNGVDVDISFISMNDVGEGIVELIYDYNIKKLVMGAAADHLYSEGMAHITSSKAKYVSQHVPHHCKIWFICNGNLIQIREGQFDRAYSSTSSSEFSDSVSSALVPYNGTRSTGGETAREFERLYKEELRVRKETEKKLQREREEHEKTMQERDEALSSARNAQILYDREVRLRRQMVVEVEKSKEEMEKMKREMEEVLNMDFPHIIEAYRKERDDAMKTTEELLRQMNMEGTSSLISPSGSNEPSSYFLCPISKEIMQEPHVAADGYTYEAKEFKKWLRHGGETSPITNIRLQNRNLTPNLTLRSVIREWLQQHPEYRNSP